MNEERWRDLCETIMKETDPCRLSQLVEALNIELVRERELRHVRKQLENQDENS